jgi:hypothetical protein
MQSARETWNDERLNELSARVDRGFQKVDREIRELGADMTSGHDALRQEIRRFGGGLFIGLLIAVLEGRF